MEAVPRLPMLSFDLKTSSDSPSFGPKLKQYIRDFYNEDPEMYSNEIHNLEGLRAQAVCAVRSVSGCQALKRYYCQLHFLQSRFPMAKDGSAAVTFTWQDTYSSMVCTLADIRFEMVCILYNIGALHSQLGASDSRVSADGMKMCCTHFQCSAWAFQHLKDTYPQPPGVDLAPIVMQFMYHLTLAQAQECILEKSMMDNRKATIIAKVAVQVVEYYNLSMNTLEHSGPDDCSVADTVGSKLFKNWRRYVKFKIVYHSAVSLLYQGQQAEEQQKMGERVAFYQAASEKLKEAMKLSKGLDDIEAVNEALAFTMDVIEGKKKAAKNENEFIYHEEVPDKDSLPDVKGASLVKGIPFNVNDPEISGPDIFARLVPMKAHEASSMYSEEKAKLRRRIGIMIDEKDQQLVGFMNSLQLEQLNVSSDPDMLPQELVDRCAALSAKPNAIQDLIDSMNKLADTYHDVEGMLQDTKELLELERKREKEYQDVMGKRPPSIVATDLTRESNKYQEAHAKASESNQTLHKAMTLHISNLRILSKSLSELQRQIPTISILNSPGDEASIKEMQHLLSKVEEMKTQRAMLANSLRAATSSDDITTQLVTRSQESLETIFQQEMQKHERIVATIEQNLAAQDNILKALTEAYARYAPTRKATIEILRNREATINALISSYDAYEDLLAKSAKGLEFYRKLETNVNKLYQRVKSTCKVQDEEREQILVKNHKVIPSGKTPSTAAAAVDKGAVPDTAPPSKSGPKLKDYLASMKISGTVRGYPITGQEVSPYFNAGYGPIPPAASPLPTAYYDHTAAVPSDPSYQWIPSVRPAPVGSEATSASTIDSKLDTSKGTPHHYGYPNSTPNTSNFSQSYAGYNTPSSMPFNYNTTYTATTAQPSSEPYASGYPSAATSTNYNYTNSNTNQYMQQYQPIPSQTISTTDYKDSVVTSTPAGTVSGQTSAYPMSGQTGTSTAGYVGGQSASGTYAASYQYQDGSQYSSASGVYTTGLTQHQQTYPTQQQPQQPQTYPSQQQQMPYPSQQSALPGQTQAYPQQQQSTVPAKAQQQPQAYPTQTPQQQQQSTVPAKAQQQPQAYPTQTPQQQQVYSSQQQQQQTYPLQSLQQHQQYPTQPLPQQPYPSQATPQSHYYSQVSQQPHGYPLTQDAVPPQPQVGASTVHHSSQGYPVVSTPQSSLPSQVSSTVQQPASSTNIQGSYVTQPGYTYNSATGQYEYTSGYQASASDYPSQQPYSVNTSVTNTQGMQSWNQEQQAQHATYSHNITSTHNTPTAGATFGNEFNSKPSNSDTSISNGFSSEVSGTPQHYPANVQQQYSYPVANVQQAMSQTNMYGIPSAGYQYGASHASSYTSAGSNSTSQISSSQTSINGQTFASQYNTSHPITGNTATPYGQGSYYSVPYGYQHTADDSVSTPTASPQHTVQGQQMTYIHSREQNPTTTTNSQPGSSLSSSASLGNISTKSEPSNIDLLSGLDFTLNQTPLTPQKPVTSNKKKEEQQSAKLVDSPKKQSDTNDVLKKVLESSNSTENQLTLIKQVSTTQTAKEGTDATSGGDKQPELPPKVEQQGGSRLSIKDFGKDPFTDPESLNQFVQEVEKFEKFVEGLTTKTLNGPTPLDMKWKELLELQEKDAHNHIISVARCYPMKNRFPDILPYDSSRVELPSTKDDYINASYIKDLTPMTPSFIVTQAPLPSTYADFWTMVWEQQVEVIVCLLSDAELQDIYWPVEKSQELTIGRMKLSLQSCNTRTHWVERIVSVSVETRATRVIVHLQFTAWPGSSFPASPSPFLGFVSEALNYYCQQRGPNHPVVVHCLSGVGRTGLFCLVTTALCDIQAGRGLVDPVKTTARMSVFRKGSLRDREHLKFAYQAILYYAQDMLMKRGILTSRSTFDDKPGRGGKGHTRHPSQDFLLGPPTDLSQLQSGIEKMGLAATNRTDWSAAESDECRRSGALSAQSNSASSSGRSSPTHSLVDGARCSLKQDGKNRKRFTKESFTSSRKSLECLERPDDPLSQLDPLWRLK